MVTLIRWKGEIVISGRPRAVRNPNLLSSFMRLLMFAQVALGMVAGMGNELNRAWLPRALTHAEADGRFSECSLRSQIIWLARSLA